MIYLWYGIEVLAYSSKLKSCLFTPFIPLILNFRGPTWENTWDWRVTPYNKEPQTETP